MNWDWDEYNERTRKAFLAGRKSGESALASVRKERLDYVEQFAKRDRGGVGEIREAETGGSSETDDGQSSGPGGVTAE
jgi:hypothetical protein